METEIATSLLHSAIKRKSAPPKSPEVRSSSTTPKSPHTFEVRVDVEHTEFESGDVNSKVSLSASALVMPDVDSKSEEKEINFRIGASKLKLPPIVEGRIISETSVMEQKTLHSAASDEIISEDGENLLFASIYMSAVDASVNAASGIYQNGYTYVQPAMPWDVKLQLCSLENSKYI